MTYGKHCSLVIRKEFGEQVKRFHVEVVRRFIENENVTRVAKEASQQQAVAFTAAKRTDGTTGAVRREKEVLQIT